jgi:hypothetical protein
MVCDPRLEVFVAMGERYTGSEIRITPYKRGLPTWGSSVGYVGNEYGRVPHYGLRG